MSLVSFDVGFSQEGNEEKASDAIFIIRLAVQNIINISCVTILLLFVGLLPVL